jgi:hypothetical protein
MRQSECRGVFGMTQMRWRTSELHKAPAKVGGRYICVDITGCITDGLSY